MRTYLPCLLALLLVGCSGVEKIGQVGDVEFYSVSDANALAPSYTSHVALHNGKTIVAQQWAQAGWFPSLFGATMKTAGDVGAAALYGHSLPENKGDHISVSAGGGLAISSSESKAKAKAEQSQSQEQSQDQRQYNPGGLWPEDDDGRPDDCRPQGCD